MINAGPDPGCIVRTLAGRDAGRLFVVVEVETDYAMLSDGRTRRVEAPKKKKLKHLRVTSPADMSEKTTQKLCDGQEVTNSEIRKMLEAGEQK